MADEQNLLDQARALGESMARHPRIQAFIRARKRLQEDDEAQQLLKAYSEQTERLHRLEVERKPIEVADKRKLAECERKVASNALLKEFMAAQVDYVTLMNRVNQAMETPLAANQKSDQPS